MHHLARNVVTRVVPRCPHRFVPRTFKHNMSEVEAASVVAHLKDEEPGTIFDKIVSGGGILFLCLAASSAESVLLAASHESLPAYYI